MGTWAEFNPLKSCVIGTLPQPSDIISHTKLTNRYKDYFAEILHKGIQELDALEKVLGDFKVVTHRSVQKYTFHNGKTVTTPPLAVRDIFTVYGNSLFKGNYAFEWNKDVPGSCDHVLDSEDFDSVYELPSNDIFFDGDYSNFNIANDLPRPMFHPPLTLKCGNDIIVAKDFGNSGNKAGYDIFKQWTMNVNPKARFHVLDTIGHIDAQIFMIRPGLMLTSMSSDKLPDFFDRWEKIYVEPVTAQPLHKKHAYRHKKFHPVIAQSFYNFLETCTEETYFELNSLSINENTVLFTGVHKDLFNQLEKKGVTCVPISWKATTFWDTGVHCATNELERQGDLEDYA